MTKQIRLRILFACGYLLFAAANWPLLILVNRIEPFIFGLPTFVFAMFALNFLVAILLLIAYRMTE
jgi:hypothetical protein